MRIHFSHSWLKSDKFGSRTWALWSSQKAGLKQVKRASDDARQTRVFDAFCAKRQFLPLCLSRQNARQVTRVKTRVTSVMTRVI